MLSAEPRKQTRLVAEASRKCRAAYLQHQGVLPKNAAQELPKNVALAMGFVFCAPFG
jgi:hypothetical protein